MRQVIRSWAVLAAFLVGAAGLVSCDVPDPEAERPDAPEVKETGETPPAAETPESPQPEPFTGEWRLWHGNQGLTGVADDASPLGDKLAVKWRFDAGGAITSAAVIADGKAYVAAETGAVFAVDIRSGKKVWNYGTKSGIYEAPLAVDDLVVVGTGSGKVHAIDAASGTKRWVYDLGPEIMGAPNYVRSDGLRIVVTAYDETGGESLYCHAIDATSGKRLWEFETADRINGGAAVGNGKIYLGGCGGVLYVLDAANGKEVGTVGAGIVAGSPAVTETTAYIPDMEGELSAHDLVKDKFLWFFSANDRVISTPAIGEEIVVVGSWDTMFYGLKRTDGEQVWSFATGDKIESSPVIAGDRVLGTSGDGFLYMLDLATGKELWSFELGGYVVPSPAVAGNRVVVGGGETLFAFGPAGEE